MATEWKTIHSSEHDSESSRDSRELETSELLHMGMKRDSRFRKLSSHIHTFCLYLIIIVLSIAITFSVSRNSRDPSLGKLYSESTFKQINKKKKLN